MTQSRDRSSFSAYTGEVDIQLDLAPMHAGVRGSSRQSVDSPPTVRERRGHLHIWILLFILFAAGVFAVSRYQDQMAAGVAEVRALMSEMNLPEMNLPQLSRPSINRAINTVRMESALTQVTEQEVRTLLARYTESGFLGVDVQDLRAELELNPWIAQAMVRRVWPDVLAIRIVEEVPFARWGDDALVNREGRVFVADITNHELKLPRLLGPAGTEELVMDSFERFSAVLLRTGLIISSLSLSERGSWVVETQDGPQLFLGREGMDMRLSRFAGMYEKGLREHLTDARTIDLRYSNGFSVSRTSDGAGSVASR